MQFAILLKVATFLGPALASLCSMINGYSYCSDVQKIVYDNVGFSSSYTDVVLMDESGSSLTAAYSFSGDMAPLDEELSVHFRGPLKLSQFAVYYPASGSSKKKRDAAADECSSVKHVHHKHVKRDIVYLTKTVNQFGQVIGASSTAKSEDAVDTVVLAVENSATDAASASATVAAAASDAASSETAQAVAGDWSRTSYYTPGTGLNVTFLNNFGGRGSGVWSSAWGNSLSYANADNSDADTSATLLDDVTIGSNSEFSIWSSDECGDSAEDGDCGYYRAGIPAYHGFAGDTKMFLFEFTMPATSDSGFNADMPAIWFLNAKIPRIGQYISASCWDSGCGEFDAFEILYAQSTKMVSCLHSKQGGSGMCNTNYMTRPTSSSMKAAVIFNGRTIDIQILDDSVSFDSFLDEATVNSWLEVSGAAVTLAD